MERPAGAEEKPWGWALALNDQKYERADGSLATQVRTVRVFIRQGGFSSIHRHGQCSNIFSVIKGKLRLRDYIAPAEPGEPPVYSAQCTIEEGDHPVTFPPGCLHQFEALTDVVALEIYVAAKDGDASAADIERFTNNGVRVANIVQDVSGTTIMDVPSGENAKQFLSWINR